MRNLKLRPIGISRCGSLPGEKLLKGCSRSDCSSRLAGCQCARVLNKLELQSRTHLPSAPSYLVVRYSTILVCNDLTRSANSVSTCNSKPPGKANADVDVLDDISYAQRERLHSRFGMPVRSTDHTRPRQNTSTTRLVAYMQHIELLHGIKNYHQSQPDFCKSKVRGNLRPVSHLCFSLHCKTIAPLEQGQAYMEQLMKSNAAIIYISQMVSMKHLSQSRSASMDTGYAVTPPIVRSHLYADSISSTLEG